MSIATAIGQPQRWIKARIVSDDLTIDTLIETLEGTHGLLTSNNFEIGNAIASGLKAIVNDDGSLALYDFTSKEFRWDMGINTGTMASPVFEYVTIGYYTVEEAKRSSESIELRLSDRMYRFNPIFTGTFTFPISLMDILLAVCDQAGITLATASFTNDDYMVQDMALDNIPMRVMLKAIAELAGGYAVINANGQLEILTLDLNDLSPKEITDDNIDLDGSTINETAQTLVDKVIVQTGEVSAEYGTGTNVLTVLNNLFAQSPEDLVENIYNQLNGLAYAGIALSWQGDFTLPLGKTLQIETKGATLFSYLLNRVLYFDGGLSENTFAPAKSAVVKDNPIQGSLKLLVDQHTAEIRVVKDSIALLVSEVNDLEENTASLQVSVDGINATVSQHTDELGTLSTEVSQTAEDLTLTISSLDELKTYYQYDANGLTIGREDSPAQIFIGYENVDEPYMSLTDGSNEVAKLKSNNLEISNATIRNSLIVGQHKITFYNIGTEVSPDWITIVQQI